MDFAALITSLRSAWRLTAMAAAFQPETIPLKASGKRRAQALEQVVRSAILLHDYDDVLEGGLGVSEGGAQ